ncbi:hypothetical protein H310_04153 [Aphanomyces invadans]|uniref:Transmembrane protein 267 n=1 Tax=Aphanomyces invadans TaxID=157072 RepID=A0A024UG16_9STRA|nr:hypothetical protein H310_04153 [Aphanomyces invadans]ETW05145.1 hypothetical protein H310_04153 [Aphanomyces invadans]|eukprot:XP_008866583.1 hypothetical protein H310_04153 [Aphanomyces invadans]
MASHVSIHPHKMVSIAEAIAAVAVGSLLDADHFVAARAFSLRAATSLNDRPWGHSVTFIIAVALIAWKALPAPFNLRGAALLFVCLLSHQLRDSFRRGLWFAPLGSTPPLPYWVYLVLEVLVPLGVGTWLRCHSRYIAIPSQRATPQDAPEIHTTLIV